MCRMQKLWIVFGLFMVLSMMFVDAWSQTDIKSEKELKALAKKGNPEDQKNLGNYYYEQKNYQEAKEWWLKAANQGYVKAQHNLGLMYEKGNGVNRNCNMAAIWYEKAAKQNFVLSQYSLASICVNCLKDTARAERWYRQAANNGSDIAMIKLGQWYENGFFFEKNEKTAVFWYKKAASQEGDEAGYAMYLLGKLYEEAIIIDRDLDTAIYWYRKSAAQGNRQAVWAFDAKEKYYGNASYRMGRYYEKKDKFDKAKYWYEKSSNHGNSDAMYQLGQYYYYGYGIGINYKKAIDWYTAAAEAGNRYAQGMLGYLYDAGENVKKDEHQAMYWYKRAALKLLSTAMHNMAIYYYYGTTNGKTIEKNDANAFSWFRRAARGRYYPDAQMVAYMYEKGIGVDKDIKKAQCWYTIAAIANPNDDRNTSNLARLGGSMDAQMRKAIIYDKPQIEIVYESEKAAEALQDVLVDVTANCKIDSVHLLLNRQIVGRRFTFTPDTLFGNNMLESFEVKLSSGKNVLTAEAYTQSGKIECTKYIDYSEEITTSSPFTINKDSEFTQGLLPEKRIALVIGNTNYTGDKRLKNPGNDADAIAAKLSTLGFDVIIKKNLGKKATLTAINEFKKKTKNYEVALFYYAGHGISVSGVNYIIPIDAECPEPESVEDDCINLGRVLSSMESCKMKIAMFDACRNNPFQRSWRIRGENTRGFVQMNSPRGTLVSFATAPGETASDGYGKHSPYALAVLEVLDIKGLPLGEFFQRVRNRVLELTKNGQVTWESNSTLGNFFFNK